MFDDFPDDIDRFRLEAVALPAETAPTAPASPGPHPHPHPRQIEGFLKGPIPWTWVTRAAACPGRALAVGMAVWHLAGLTKRDTVGLNLSRLAPLGVGRDAARRGLAALEAAGLVRVERRPGRKPVVTIRRRPD